MKSHENIGAALVLLLLMIPTLSYGQRVVPDKPLIWNPCNTQNVRTPITEAPPYSLSMPAEVIYTYMAIDSIAKLGFTREQVAAAVMDSVGADTLSMFLSHIHKAIDYSPTIFRDYLNIGYYINDAYQSRPGMLYSQFEESVYDKLGWETVEPYLAFSDAIYEIEVTGIWEITNGRTDTSISAVLDDYLCIQAVVHDVIKGGGIRYICAGEQPVVDCVTMTVRKGWYTKYDIEADADYIISVRDSVGIDSTGATIYEITLSDENDIFYIVHDIMVGSRYIMFGRLYREYGTVNGQSYYDLMPYIGHQRAGGMFEVSNGIVRDYDNYFGWGGDSLPVNTFKDNIRAAILNMSN